MKSAFLVLLGLMFIACSNSFSGFSLPQDKSFLYGVASGTNYEDAKKSAINDLASNIDLTLKSNQNFLSDTKNGITTDKQAQNINLSTEINNLSNIEVDKVKNLKLNGQKEVFIRVRLSRLSLEKQLNEKVASYKEKALALNTSCGVKLKDKDIFNSLAKKALTTNLTLESLNLNTTNNLSTLANLYKLNLKKPNYAFDTKVDSNSPNFKIILALQSELANFVTFVPTLNAQKTIEVSIDTNYIDVSFYCDKEGTKTLLDSIRLDLNKPINKLDDFDIVRLKARLYKDLVQD
ncbi:hypothetical protein BKH43_00960 [Helicobacter sp. 13S00401-1]|uniref:hypothetical protein n=1 Tax=Helicobacter sp. 13S00401-1 TaxID=1905758 RepID=UPI000BA6A27C|nr:hypothetical protein [Helicobacter sp. 13S00401-1]PAF51834.1 hypothetical protein BKH43_00960 [Helicobacter sp. 13S00401-1]